MFGIRRAFLTHQQAVDKAGDAAPKEGATPKPADTPAGTPTASNAKKTSASAVPTSTWQAYTMSPKRDEAGVRSYENVDLNDPKSSGGLSQAELDKDKRARDLHLNVQGQGVNGQAAVKIEDQMAKPAVYVLDDYYTGTQDDDATSHGQRVAQEIAEEGVDKNSIVGWQTTAKDGIPGSSPIDPKQSPETKQQQYAQRAETLAAHYYRKQTGDVQAITDKAQPGSVINSSTGFSKVSVAEDIIREQNITDPAEAALVIKSVSEAMDKPDGLISTAKNDYNTALKTAKDKNITVVAAAGNDQEKVSQGFVTGKNGQKIQLTDKAVLTPDAAVNQFSKGKDVISVGSLDKGADGQAGTADDKTAAYSAGGDGAAPDLLAANDRSGTSFSTSAAVAGLFGNDLAKQSESQQISALSRKLDKGIVAAAANGTPGAPTFGPESKSDTSYSDGRQSGVEFSKGEGAKQALTGLEFGKSAEAAKALQNEKAFGSTDNYIAAAIADAKKNGGKNDVVRIEKGADGKEKVILTVKPGMTLWDAGEASVRLDKAANGDKDAYTISDSKLDGSAVQDKLKTIKTADGQPVKNPGNIQAGEEYDITGLVPEALMKAQGTTTAPASNVSDRTIPTGTPTINSSTTKMVPATNLNQAGVPAFDPEKLPASMCLNNPKIETLPGSPDKVRYTNKEGTEAVSLVSTGDSKNYVFTKYDAASNTWSVSKVASANDVIVAPQDGTGLEDNIKNQYPSTLRGNQYVPGESTYYRKGQELAVTGKYNGKAESYIYNDMGGGIYLLDPDKTKNKDTQAQLASPEAAKTAGFEAKGNGQPSGITPKTFITPKGTDKRDDGELIRIKDTNSPISFAHANSTGSDVFILDGTNNTLEGSLGDGNDAIVLNGSTRGTISGGEGSDTYSIGGKNHDVTIIASGKDYFNFDNTQGEWKETSKNKDGRIYHQYDASGNVISTVRVQGDIDGDKVKLNKKYEKKWY